MLMVATTLLLARMEANMYYDEPGVGVGVSLLGRWVVIFYKKDETESQ